MGTHSFRSANPPVDLQSINHVQLFVVIATASTLRIDDDDFRSLLEKLRDAELNYENEDEMNYDEADDAPLNKGSVARKVQDQLNYQDMEDALTSAQRKEELKDLKFLEGDNNDADDKMSQQKKLKLIEDLAKLKKQALKRNDYSVDDYDSEDFKNFLDLIRILRNY